ncbi:hypothetical protein CEP88_19020 [Roseobacter denitrificans]|nr:hypothetical protein CEP88_19020 [Roseobacter denitrificans]SFF91055.1 hypothetical protein SAMN05443635_103366 [Roseobacter denitrificans OCh 114]
MLSCQGKAQRIGYSQTTVGAVTCGWCSGGRRFSTRTIKPIQAKPLQDGIVRAEDPKLVSQLQRVSSVDLYYICQMVDGVTREPGAYLRNVEDIFGDMSSSSLARKFPKWTCFHVFVEEL